MSCPPRGPARAEPGLPSQASRGRHLSQVLNTAFCLQAQSFLCVPLGYTAGRGAHSEMVLEQHRVCVLMVWSQARGPKAPKPCLSPGGSRNGLESSSLASTGHPGDRGSGSLSVCYWLSSPQFRSFSRHLCPTPSSWHPCTLGPFVLQPALQASPRLSPLGRCAGPPSPTWPSCSLLQTGRVNQREEVDRLQKESALAPELHAGPAARPWNLVRTGDWGLGGCPREGAGLGGGGDTGQRAPHGCFSAPSFGNQGPLESTPSRCPRAPAPTLLLRLFQLAFPRFFIQ